MGSGAVLLLLSPPCAVADNSVGEGLNSTDDEARRAAKHVAADRDEFATRRSIFFLVVFAISLVSENIFFCFENKRNK